MTLRSSMLTVWLVTLSLFGAACGGSSYCECKAPAKGVVTLTVDDVSGHLAAHPTFSELGASLSVACTDPAAATCPSWTFSLPPGQHTIEVTDGTSGVATSVRIDVVARSCDCDAPEPITKTVTAMAASR